MYQAGGQLPRSLGTAWRSRVEIKDDASIVDKSKLLSSIFRSWRDMLLGAAGLCADPKDEGGRLVRERERITGAFDAASCECKDEGEGMEISVRPESADENGRP